MRADAGHREGCFGPVVAAWLLNRIADPRRPVEDRDDLVTEVVDVADTALPTTFATDAEAKAQPAGIAPTLASADAFVVLTPEYNHNAGASFDGGGRLRDPSGPDAAAKTMLDQVV